MHKTIGNLRELKEFLAGMPEGTTVNILSQDLEAGNFETAHFEVPGQGTIDLDYYGFVAEGYVSPFEVAHSESDL